MILPIDFTTVLVKFANNLNNNDITVHCVLVGRKIFPTRDDAKLDHERSFHIIHSLFCEAAKFCSKMLKFAIKTSQNQRSIWTIHNKVPHNIPQNGTLLVRHLP